MRITSATWCIIAARSVSLISPNCLLIRLTMSDGNFTLCKFITLDLQLNRLNGWRERWSEMHEEVFVNEKEHSSSSPYQSMNVIGGVQALRAVDRPENWTRNTPIAD